MKFTTLWKWYNNETMDMNYFDFKESVAVVKEEK